MRRKKDEKEKQIAREEYEEMMKEFEKDSKLRSFRNPVIDRTFYAMLDDFEKNYKRRMICRVASIAAGIVIVSGTMLNCFTKVAYGETLIEIVRNSVEAGKFTITAISKNDDSKFEQFENLTLSYKAQTIDEIFEMLREDSDCKINELFYIANVSSKYQQWTARYNTRFQRLTINAEQEEEYLYILEELDYEEVVSGTVLETEIVSTIFNENLQTDIDIIKQMDGARNRGYYFDVFYNNKRIRVEGNGVLEDFELVAKSLVLLKGD